MMRHTAGFLHRMHATSLATGPPGPGEPPGGRYVHGVKERDGPGSLVQTPMRFPVTVTCTGCKEDA